MQLNGEIHERSIVVTLDEAAAAKILIENAAAQGGFMLSLCERPEPFGEYTIRLRAPDEFSFDFAARVVQIFEQPEGVAAALQLDQWTADKMEALERKLAGPAAAEEVEDPPADAEGETRGTAPIYRIRQMNPAEKQRLAMKADRPERKILCRDSSPQVLLALLANPRLESTDVLAIVKSTHASSGVLQRVAKDRRWMSNKEVQAAIVRNPKTPTPIAVQLIENVPTPELRQMAKMGALRETVRRAAFRAYTKRTSRRR